MTKMKLTKTMINQRITIPLQTKYNQVANQLG
jgi:hypothetical protein